jgi:hypothetical protein
MLMSLKLRNWICPRYVPFFYSYPTSPPCSLSLPFHDMTHIHHSSSAALNKSLTRTSCSFADAQHCDFYWAAEAVEWAYTSMLDDIESTRSKYPGEEGEERDEMQTETEFRMDVQHEG